MVAEEIQGLGRVLNVEFPCLLSGKGVSVANQDAQLNVGAHSFYWCFIA